MAPLRSFKGLDVHRCSFVRSLIIFGRDAPFRGFGDIAQHRHMCTYYSFTPPRIVLSFKLFFLITAVPIATMRGGVWHGGRRAGTVGPGWGGTAAEAAAGI